MSLCANKTEIKFNFFSPRNVNKKSFAFEKFVESIFIETSRFSRMFCNHCDEL